MALERKHLFIEWVDEVEIALGWTDNKWTTKAGISASVLSRARQGTIPKWDACLALANAANISPITAFRKAGLLPYGLNDESSYEDWQYLLAQLTPAERDEMRQIAILKINLRKKAEDFERATPFRSEIQRK